MRALALVVLTLAPSLALAVPRFALREGAPCAKCHVDPSGGGMRTGYGRSAFEVTKLPGTWATLPADAAPLDAHLSDSVTVGSDLRVLFQHLRKKGAKQPRISSFYVMEGALYLAADLWRRATLYLAPVFHGSDSVFFEAHAQFNWAWANSYVKVGRFTPAYGLKQPDHSVFTRKLLGFGPTARDSGLELGMHPGDATLQLGVFNGLSDAAASAWDDNVGKAVALRASYRLGRRGLRAELGGSALYNVTGLAKANHPTGIDTRSEDGRAGLFAGLSIGRFAWLGEAHYQRIDDRQAPEAETRFASYQELGVLLTQGLELVATYELWDQDTSVDGDAAHRAGLGVELYPWPFVELQLRMRMTFADDRHPMADVHEGLALLHVFF
jgi:hypothetical protein